jgi:hypothetical protein
LQSVLRSRPRINQLVLLNFILKKFWVANDINNT